MKKTFWKELFKTIRHTKVTFISITLFILMGMSLFFGIAWSSESITTTATKYFEQTNGYDICLKVSPGYKTPEDFENLDDIDIARGTYTYITEFKSETQGFEANFSTFTEDISVPYNVEGELPKQSGEVALIRYFAEDNNYKIGDIIELQNEPEEFGFKVFTTKTFKVTALFDSSSYIAKKTTVYGISPKANIPVNATFFVHEDSFGDAIKNVAGYSSIYMRSNKLRNMDYFSEDFYDKLNEIKTAIAESVYLRDVDNFLISTVRDGMSHQNVESTARVFNRAKYSMAGLFVVVGLLVSYFSVSRMINEDQVIIGVKKAKGFRNKEIYAFYLIYVGLAVLAGSILGTIIGRFVAEPVIAGATENALEFPELTFAFKFWQVAVFFTGELLAQAIIAIVNTKKLVKKNTVDLIKNENESVGKHRIYQKGKLWNKLSLFSKTLINNFVNGKSRVLAMLVGIGGCASLLVSAFTIDRNIGSSFDEQFENVFKFQTIIHYDGDLSTENVEKTLNDGNYRYDKFMFTYFTVEAPNGKEIAHQTYIFEDEHFDEFVNMYNVDDEKMELENGVYFSSSLQNEYKLNTKSKIQISSSNLDNFEVQPNGFFKHYLINNIMIMNRSTFEGQFNGIYKKNALVVDLGSHTFEELQSSIIRDSCVIYLYDIYGSGLYAFNSITSIFKIIDVVFLILSIVMALLVVLDLLVMFINEKKNELITLMINGYSRAKAKKYIYFDTIILSILGIVVGVLFGNLISNFVVGAFQTETMFFITGFNLECALLASGLTILIIVLVSLLALRRIKKFKLTDINKLN